MKFEGSDGWIWVTRGAIEASNPEFLTTPLACDAIRLYESNDHMGNFFDCVQSRRMPVSDVLSSHRTVSTCHLGNISMRLGRSLKWDPVKEEFIDDKEANTWLKREQRKGYEVTA